MKIANWREEQTHQRKYAKQLCRIKKYNRPAGITRKQWKAQGFKEGK